MSGYFLAICWLFWLFWLFEFSNSQEIAKCILLFVSHLCSFWLFGHFFLAFLIFSKTSSAAAMLRPQTTPYHQDRLKNLDVRKAWHCSATAAAKASDCGGTVLPLRWQRLLTAVTMQCQTSSKVLPLRWQNFPTQVAELYNQNGSCYNEKNSHSAEEKLS